MRTLTARFAAFQATANGEFATMQTQLVQFQALLGQTTRSVQDTRAQIEALREQGSAAVTAAPPPTPGDTTHRPTCKYPRPRDAVHDGQRAVEGRKLSHGAQRVRVAAGDVPELRERVGRAVSKSATRTRENGTSRPRTRYSSWSPIGIRRVPTPRRRCTVVLEWLSDANKKDEARVLANRLIKEYPRSDEAELAKQLAKP